MNVGGDKSLPPFPYFDCSGCGRLFHVREQDQYQDHDCAAVVVRERPDPVRPALLRMTPEGRRARRWDWLHGMLA